MIGSMCRRNKKSRDNTWSKSQLMFKEFVGLCSIVCILIFWYSEATFFLGKRKEIWAKSACFLEIIIFVDFERCTQNAYLLPPAALPARPLRQLGASIVPLRRSLGRYSPLALFVTPIRHQYLRSLEWPVHFHEQWQNICGRGLLVSVHVWKWGNWPRIASSPWVLRLGYVGGLKCVTYRYVYPPPADP